MSLGGHEPGISEVGGHCPPSPSAAFKGRSTQEGVKGAFEAVTYPKVRSRSRTAGRPGGSTFQLSQTRGLTCEGHCGAKHAWSCHAARPVRGG